MCKHELAPSPNYPSVVVFMIDRVCLCYHSDRRRGGKPPSHAVYPHIHPISLVIHWPTPSLRTICGFGMENLHEPKLGNNNTHKINAVTYYSLAPSPLPSPMWEELSRGRANRSRKGWGQDYMCGVIPGQLVSTTHQMTQSWFYLKWGRPLPPKGPCPPPPHKILN